MTTPTYSELYTSVQSDLKNQLGITSLVGKTVINAFAMVQAAKLKLTYLTAARIYQNIFVDTAESESLGGSLERFGLVKLGRRPFVATAGEYNASVTGSIGAVISQGTTFKSLDSSTSPDKLFTLDTDFTFVSTTGTIKIRALDLGSEAALVVGDQLQVTSPLANVDSFQEVTSVETSPTDAESYEDYRAKTIESYQVEPQGGAKTDYRIWSADAAGVRKVYPYVKDGYSGEINLYVEATITDSTDGYGSPTTTILDDVAEVIEYDPDISKPDNERGRRPMGTFQIHVLSINPLPVDVVISQLSDSSFLSAISAGIESYLYDVRPYIAGADNPTLLNIGKLYASDIYAIIKETIGAQATFTEVTVKVNSNIVTLYEFIDGYIPYLNTVTSI